MLLVLSSALSKYEHFPQTFWSTIFTYQGILRLVQELLQLRVIDQLIVRATREDLTTQIK